MDLHIHTVFSDGELTPNEIIQEAAQRGISTLSFTDHDEIRGYVIGRSEAKRLGICLLPGIELNTDGPEGELHILGYQFDPSNQALLNHIKWRKQERKHWAGTIVKRLNELHYEIELEDCLQQATGDVIVRTHIAKALHNKGYFESPKDAFEQLLKKHQPGFVERSVFTANQAIELIHNAGGVSFLAHPGIYPTEPDIEKLVQFGIDGIEVFHSKHSQEQQLYWQRKAQLFDLKMSGGSDHHGPHSRNPYPVGSVAIDEECKEYWLGRMEGVH